MMKKAWIDTESRVIVFHPVEGTKIYAEEETLFWQHIIRLCSVGYCVA